MNFLRGRRAAAQWLGTFALLFAAACVVLRPAVAAGGVLRGLGLCYETVIPALFPFMVVSRLLLESPAAGWFGLLLRPYTRLLGLRGKRAPAALLCGLLGGFACGAQAVDALYRSNELRRDEAALLLVCTIGSGPGFIVGGVGELMVGHAGAGRLLLAAQVGASLLCGCLTAGVLALRRLRTQNGAAAPNSRAQKNAAVPCAAAVFSAAPCAAAGARQAPPASAYPAAMRKVLHQPARKKSETSPQEAPKRSGSGKAAAAPAESAPQAGAEASQTGFVAAVRSAVGAAGMLCGYVTLFSFFAAIAVPASAPALLRYCAMLPLEVTGACRAACETAGAWRSELCCMALSAMGASVFFQVRALLAPEISLWPLLCSRLAHLPLALVLFRLAGRLFPAARTAGAQLDAAILPAVRMPPDVTAVLFVLCALACGALRPQAKANG